MKTMASPNINEKTSMLSIQGLSVSKPELETPQHGDMLEDRFGSFVGSEDASDPVQNSLVEQFVKINLGLEKQIDTLRLRLEFNDKHHQASTEAVKMSTESDIRTKQSKIDILKNELINKEASLSKLEEESEDKWKSLTDLQTQMNEMKEHIELAATWVTDVQIDIVNLESANRDMESGETYQKTQKEVEQLKKELYSFQQNVKVMSKELKQARELIVAQGNSIRILETDKLNMQVKFKEDLQKVTKSLRLEVERIRDIMQSQWKEMRTLREQNQNVRQDVREIRDLLSVAQPDSSRLGFSNNGFVKPSFPKSKNPTRRNPHPTLPTLTPRRHVVQKK